MTTGRASLWVGVLAVSLAAVRAANADPNLPVTGQVVELSPFKVSWERIPWRYGTLPGYEILSSYPDSVTREFTQGLDHAWRLVHLFVPDTLLASFDVPRSIILGNPDYMSSLSQDILREEMVGETWPGAGIQSTAGAQVFPNMELNDSDRTVAFVSRLSRRFQPASEKMGDSGLRLLLERRTPAPPPWFVTGILNLYSGVAAVSVDRGMTNLGGVHAAQTTGPRVYSMNEMDAFAREDARPRTDGSYSGIISYRIPPFAWLSEAGARLLSPRHDDFCPGGEDKASVMRALLAADPPEEAAARQIWDSRAALFVRWGLYGDHPGRLAFWEFVARAAAEPVTETLFRQYFGMDFAAAASLLNDYLPDAVEEPIDLQIETGPGLPPVQLRPAASSEVARMKGDWERLVFGHVKQLYSDQASGYIKSELIQACASSPRDARLQSVLGLFDCDTGAGSEGAPFLEAAAKANVQGPRVYFRLAEMRYGGTQASGDRRLGPAETARVIDPLEAGCRQSPALREDYELMGKVLSHSEAGISRRQLDLFDAGLEKFPMDLDLLYQAAALNLANGYRSEASAMAKRGLERSSTPPDRDRFSRLLAEAGRALDSGPAK